MANKHGMELRGGQWSARVRDASGKQYRVSLHTTDADEAKAKLYAIRAAMKRGIAAPTASTFTLGDAFDRALSLHYRGMSSKRTVGFHRKSIAAAVAETTKLSDITVAHYEAIVEEHQRRGNSDVTMNRTFETLGRVLTLAHGWHMMPLPAPKVPQFKEHPGRIRVFTADEEAQIVAEFNRMAHPEMADFTVFMVDTGFRLGEYHRRDRQCHHEARKAFEVWRTKAGDGRTLPLTARAQEAALRLLAAPALTKDQIESRWQTMRRNIGMQADTEFVIHALRHTCCTRLWRSGKMTAAQIMAWMGHKDIKTTLRYTHLNEGDLQVGASALEGVHA